MQESKFVKFDEIKDSESPIVDTLINIRYPANMEKVNVGGCSFQINGGWSNITGKYYFDIDPIYADIRRLTHQNGKWSDKDVTVTYKYCGNNYSTFLCGKGTIALICEDTTGTAFVKQKEFIISCGLVRRFGMDLCVVDMGEYKIIADRDIVHAIFYYMEGAAKCPIDGEMRCGGAVCKQIYNNVFCSRYSNTFKLCSKSLSKIDLDKSMRVARLIRAHVKKNPRTDHSSSERTEKLFAMAADWMVGFGGNPRASPIMEHFFPEDRKMWEDIDKSGRFSGKSLNEIMRDSVIFICK